MSGRCNFETLCLGERNQRRLTAGGQYCSLGQIKIRPSPPRSFMAIEDIVPLSTPTRFPTSLRKWQQLRRRGVRLSVVPLPRVHDRDKQGLVTFMIALARRKVISAFIGDGLKRWPAVILVSPEPRHRRCSRYAKALLTIAMLRLWSQSPCACRRPIRDSAKRAANVAHVSTHPSPAWQSVRTRQQGSQIDPISIQGRSWRVPQQNEAPSSALGDLEPSERREGGSRVRLQPITSSSPPLFNFEHCPNSPPRAPNRNGASNPIVAASTP
jgi:hypothetical protein